MKRALVAEKPARSKISYIPKTALQLRCKHFLTGEELSQAELIYLLNHAITLKKERKLRAFRPRMRSMNMALLLEKPSLRTKFSFTVAMQELGGTVIESHSSQRKSETPADTARVLSGYCDVIVIRTFGHDTLEAMAKVSRVPIVNALSDSHHPCQVLADLMTLQERFGNLQGLRVTYVGDGNNMLHSLLLLLPYLGIDFHFACPEGAMPDAEILQRATLRAAMGGGNITSHKTAAEAAAGANAIYTDVWTSMGFEDRQEVATDIFAEFQLNEALYSQCAPDAVIMHCMPIVRGQEITDAVADHVNSVLFIQSENRLHVQKALLDLMPI